MKLKPELPEFLKLARKGNVIPVYTEINADLDTPVSAYLKTARGRPYAFLLESVEGQEKVARYSFLGSNPSLIFSSTGRNISILRPHTRAIKRFTTASTPLDEIKKIMQGFKSVRVPGLPRFYGGLVGYIGYDMVRFFERIPDKNKDGIGSPDALLILTDTLLIFDHVNHTVKIVSNVILPAGSRSSSRAVQTRLYREAAGKIARIERDFNAKPPRTKKPAVSKDARVCSNISREEFRAAVKKAKRYIRRGDIIQTVLSQRFSARLTRDPFEVYRTLRSLNPSPYMYYLKLGGTVLIGASPEMLVRCEDGIVQTRPIAGTRPRGKDDADDARMARELISDLKERAEHLMLVDLGRNDLGRVCRTGTVNVHEFMGIEKYSHVMHLVSEVRGKLDKPRYDIYDVLKAAFPAGTVSGSPKIRAMEIIDELENTRRGPYAGCVGYFSFSHNMDTCITIRTIVVRDTTAHVQAGAGIVADSRPAREYDETVNKAKALIIALTQ